MKRKMFLLPFIISAILVIILPSCDDEETHQTFPLSAEIFHSTAGKQVAFTALTHSADSLDWDFGDGKTSSEKNPVHIYEEGGYYIASLTAKDKDGNSVTKVAKLAIDLTPYALLTGDHTADGYNGKTWKLTADHPTGGDYFANANENLTPVKGVPAPLPTGIFDLEFKMGNVYKDEFTFFFDGSYKHDVKEDGGAFGGIVYQYATTGGTEIINANGAPYGLCIAKYVPESDASFTYIEKENFTTSSVYAPGGVLTFKDVSTLSFSGTEFIGFRDFERKVILRSISNTRMQLIMFMAASDQAIGVNTHALILSFEVVN